MDQVASSILDLLSTPYADSSERNEGLKDYGAGERYFSCGREVPECLAGGPVEMAAGEEVVMEVPHRLAAVVVAVDDEAEAALGKALLPGNSAGDKGHVTHEGSVFLGEIVDGGNVPAGDDQVVEGCLGGDVL